MHYRGKAVLLSSELDRVHVFDGAMTDEQIWDAVSLANRAYGLGAKAGNREKAQQIRRALEII